MCIHTNHLRILSKGIFWLSRCGERPENCISNKLSDDAADATGSLFQLSPPEWKTETLPWLMLLWNGEDEQWCSQLALQENEDIQVCCKQSQITGLEAENTKSWEFTQNFTLVLPTELCITLSLKVFFFLIDLWTINFWKLRYGWHIKRPYIFNVCIMMSLRISNTPMKLPLSRLVLPLSYYAMAPYLRLL